MAEHLSLVEFRHASPCHSKSFQSFLKKPMLFVFPSFTRFKAAALPKTKPLLIVFRSWHSPCEYALHKPRREANGRGERFEEQRRKREMKKMLAQKIIQFLMNWLRSRFVQRTGGKSKFGNPKLHKKISPKHIHLLKASQLVKDGFRQKFWTKR